VKKLVLTATAFIAASCPVLPAAASGAGSAELAIPKRPNFVVVMTDDQRWNTLWAMPFVNQTLRPLALDFRHAYVTTPQCCPARASLLSGGFYAHNVGVLSNSSPNGGAASFDDLRSMPLELQRAGYQTALVGKYLNGYHTLTPRVPPGWTHFAASLGSGNWTRFDMAIGSSGAAPGRATIESFTGHIVEFEFEEALRFLDDRGTEPFFLLVSAEAPHPPATPPALDAHRHSGHLYRGRSWGEKDLSDKPRFVRRRAGRFKKRLTAKDEFHRDQLRSLAAVDRGVEAIYDLLARQGELRSTVFVFTSDNGFLWGEHKLEGKNLPYEESIRVPLLVSLAGAATGENNNLVAMNLDLGATILDLAGIYPKRKALRRHTDGLSLRPFLKGSELTDDAWRNDLLIQSFSRGFAALLTRAPLGDAHRHKDAGWAWKYVEHGAGGVREVYRSDIDRFETESLHDDPEFNALHRDQLAKRLGELRGLHMVTSGLPPGRKGSRYSEELRAVGAAGPYTWTIVDGELPRGMRVHRRKGLVIGTPKEAGTFRFSVRVEANSIARYTKEPQAFTRKFRLKIKG
jgi:arylsulfatase A-like enzyme